MESKFYEKDKLLIFKMTDEIDDHSVQKIRRKADYEMERDRERNDVINGIKILWKGQVINI